MSSEYIHVYIDRDQNNHPIDNGWAALFDKDKSVEIRKRQIVFGLWRQVIKGVSRENLIILKMDGHHAPKGERGLSKFVTGFTRVHRRKNANVVDYRKSAYNLEARERGIEVKEKRIKNKIIKFERERIENTTIAVRLREMGKTTEDVVIEEDVIESKLVVEFPNGAKVSGSIVDIGELMKSLL